jgi:hypothetical protein
VGFIYLEIAFGILFYFIIMYVFRLLFFVIIFGAINKEIQKKTKEIKEVLKRGGNDV